MNLTIKGFLRKEFSQTLRDPRMRVLIFVAPIVQLVIFGYAISTEVSNIRFDTYFSPGDTMAQRIEERCLASGWFVPAAGPGRDPYQRIQSGRAEAVLIAPPGGLTRAMQRNEGRLQLLVDTTNMIRARGIERYIQMVIQQVVSEASLGQEQKPMLNLDIRVLYNPGMKTAFFMVPGVMVMLVCILTIIMTSMSLAREKEIGTFETLVAAPVRNGEILLGKTLPFLILGMVLVLIILAASMLIFGLPLAGAFWKFILSSFIFVCTTVSIGILISTLARNQQQAMMGSFLFMFPGILLSGMMFPIENMPPTLIGIAYLNPLKYFLTLLRNIMLKGGDDRVFWINLGVLVLMAVIAMGISFKRFRQTLN
ncbi:ABC transporter permease [bacterium]|nr:ABC transporter permease [bacterium]